MQGNLLPGLPCPHYRSGVAQKLTLAPDVLLRDGGNRCVVVRCVRSEKDSSLGDRLQPAVEGCIGTSREVWNRHNPPVNDSAIRTSSSINTSYNTPTVCVANNKDCKELDTAINRSELVDEGRKHIYLPGL